MNVKVSWGKNCSPKSERVVKTFEDIHSIKVENMVDTYNNVFFVVYTLISDNLLYQDMFTTIKCDGLKVTVTSL